MASTKKIFGIDLETVVHRENTSLEGTPKTVPNIIIETIQWLEEHNALNEEGIFRVPGNGSLIQEIKKQYDDGKANLSQYQNSDIHTIAGLLKLYLRELPEPLFIWRYYSTFIKVIKNQDALQKLLHLRMLVYGLPKVNRDLVLYLMSFLNRISTKSTVNKMTSVNLATVFAPNILRPQKESLNQIMEDSNFVTSIIKVIIDEIAFISKVSIHLSSSPNDIPSANIPKSTVSSSEHLIAKALYPYQASGQWHLPFKKDDQIILLDIKLEEGWLKGELNGKIGYFPSSYVEIVAIPPPNTPVTLVPIPDLFDSTDFTLSTPLSASSSSISTSSSSLSLNGGELMSTTPPPISLSTTTTTTTTINTTTVTTSTTTFTVNPTTASTPTPISVSKSTSSNSLKTTPTSRSTQNLLASVPPPLQPLPTSNTLLTTVSTVVQQVSTPPQPVTSTSKSGSNSNISSPDLSKFAATNANKLTAPPPLSVPSLVPPPPLQVGTGSPIPNTSSQASTASSQHPISQVTKSGSFSASPDFKSPYSSGFPSIQQQNKLSSSGTLPPLGVPPPLLPSKLLSSQISQLSLSSGSNVSPPTSSPLINHKPISGGGSYIEFSTPPPPPPLNTDFPTIIPQPIQTPQKTTANPLASSGPLPIDLSNLPPPPFSPLSPEQLLPISTLSDLPPPPPPPDFGELPPPPPPLFAGELPVTIQITSTASQSSLTTTTTTTDIARPIPPPPPPPGKLDRKNSYMHKKKENLEKIAEEKKKRRERAEEVLSTEKTYVKQLTVVHDYFIEPLKKNSKQYGLTAEDVMNIFSCLEVILNGHKSNILKALEERMTMWDQKPQLGDIFVNGTSFIKLYKHYVNNFDKSLQTLKQCKEKYPEFKQYMASLDYSEKLSGLSLESFLILPVQRLPRYVLLLQDLLKYTANDHEDFDQLCEALSVVKDLTENINFKKSEEDNQNKIQQIQDQIKGLPPSCMSMRRKFIDEGLLMIKKDKYYIFLFSDAMIVTKPSKDKKKFKHLINLQTASLNTMEDPNILKIISQEGTFKFTCDQAKDREHWTKTIKEVIESAQLEMIQSAFGESTANMNEGSKGFNRIQDEKNSKKKQELTQELYTSEEEYVEHLQYIQNVFLSPIKKSLDSPNPMVSYTESLEICSNFETLLSCHVTFLQHLKERVNDYTNKPLVSDLFVEKAAFLKLYNYYVQNHIKQIQVFDGCLEKYPSFAIHIKRLEADEKAELKVLLAEPLRRVPRYYLLMREILQYTRPKHDDHETLTKVVHNLKEQTDKFNTLSISSEQTSSGSKSPITKYKTLKGKGKFLTKDSKLSQSAIFNLNENTK
ncbi:pleckstrin (PH) domain-containing protein [Tieghemostelium lacteum]|uniref:Pleckstrin (PH) domain-containing protein n=1 Tax=Tieghemostelium lacteum TaxID=361077 RepID=A0A152A328_TIELA|nr:pleckstrin (PH) domain-containing protein [Tieghemostelium lacteum]|eukprot:KYR00663.1 pleckstrin (PH) domain-containing protein [Tieghemostelium lacteum]